MYNLSFSFSWCLLKSKSFWWIHFIFFFFSCMDSAFGVKFKNSLSNPGSQRFYLLEQESAAFDVQTSSVPQLVIINVLREHSHPHSFTYYLSMLSLCGDSWIVDTEIVWLRNLKYSLYGPFQKMFPDPCSRIVSILALIMSVIQYELFFVYVVWGEGLSSPFFHMDLQLFQYHLLKRRSCK